MTRNKKEYLDFLHDLEFALEWDWDKDSIDIIHGIRQLIEEKPKISVKELIGIISQDNTNEHILHRTTRYLFDYLKSHGVEIEE